MGSYSQGCEGAEAVTCPLVEREAAGGAEAVQAVLPDLAANLQSQVAAEMAAVHLQAVATGVVVEVLPQALQLSCSALPHQAMAGGFRQATEAPSRLLAGHTPHQHAQMLNCQAAHLLREAADQRFQVL